VASTLTLADLKKAWATRDPRFAKLVADCAVQEDPVLEPPPREGAPSFDGWIRFVRSGQLKRKPKPEQAAARVERLKAVEVPDAEVPLPERRKIHEVILELWNSDDALARDTLLQVIADVPLVYGPWRALKRIFKEAEAKNDTEVYGALAARFDSAGSQHHGGGEVTGATLAYLARRAWRYLRRVAVQLPATYPDVAVDLLCRYPEATNWPRTWIWNHITFHETKRYGRAGFHFDSRSQPKPSELKHRAYGDLWKRSPRPLFTLLELARSEPVREFAVAGLKADFKPVLREVEPEWVARLAGVESAAVHDFMVWILQNVPKFEQSAFRKLGLHDAVLRLFDSPSAAARKYAAEYARIHARDLTLDQLVRLANNSDAAVQKLVTDLLGERDPRKDVGLEGWGRLLETAHGHAFAAQVLLKSFGAKELTPAWFAERLLRGQGAAGAFAQANLLRLHPAKTLGTGFFVDLLKKLDPANGAHQAVANWAMNELKALDLPSIPREDLRWLALFPLTASGVEGWIGEGKIAPQAFGIDFWKTLAFEPDWDASEWRTVFAAANGDWATALTFDETRADAVLARFADVRAFTNAELGFDWLMKLVARSEPRYADFAKNRLIRSFVPANFAPTRADAPPVAAAGPTAADLKKGTFLFTGKLATMTREESEAKVKAANGVVAGSVTKTLHYLVIGDEGSPLYGQGKKGSKQTKAEDLNAAGANIRIISETMFLQMLSGAPVAAADADSTRLGSEALWTMAVAPGPADAPAGAFAREYLRKHHPALALAETSRPVDPGAEVPADFFTWERFAPLFTETRKPLRDFALAFAPFEFARWNPDAEDLVALAENPFVDVRRFAAKALLAEPGKESVPYRLDPAKLDAATVYRLCESAVEETRALGMELIRRLPKLRVPESLFLLSQSTDRKVRAFVVRSLWSVYRDRGVTADWKPPVPPAPTVGARAKQEAAKREAEIGPGVPARPGTWPADQPTLAQFLRRILFELPPGPPPRAQGAAAAEEGEATADKAVSLKPIPARRAKLDAVETMRDLAIEDEAFAAGILPLLDEFVHSKGKSEQAACLVAITRIRHRYPRLSLSR